MDRHHRQRSCRVTHLARHALGSVGAEDGQADGAHPSFPDALLVTEARSREINRTVVAGRVARRHHVCQNGAHVGVG